MDGNLGTTNVILLVMAIVSVLEALLLIGLGIGGFLLYRRVMQVVNNLEARQIAPLREKVEAILTDVKSVTARVNTQAERVNHAISGTIDRVDDTAERMKSTVRDKVNQPVGVVRGIRAVLMSLLTSESRPKPPAPAAGTA